MRRASALIVGGGPAGSAAAILLAQAGVSPLLVERSAGDRDVVCGGFLGWDSIAALTRLGVDPAAIGARPIGRLRLLSGGQRVERALPKAAAGLSRRRLDAALMKRAAEEGARILRGRAVRSIEGNELRMADGETLRADAIFLATGKHDLRGASRETGDRPLSVGLRTTVGGSDRLQRELAGTIELHLFDGGYAGLLIQEDGSINLCLSVSRTSIAKAGSPDRLVEGLAARAPFLADRLSAGHGRWEAIAGVPYGWRASDSQAGHFRVGDQAAVIASLAGDGIAFALASGEAAARAFLAEGVSAASPFQAAFARRARTPIRLAEWLRGAAEHSWPRPLLMALARIPGLAGSAARLTRIS